MPHAIWLNGRFVERPEALVSALDAGLQHGVGLFETMRAQGGSVFRLFDHLSRLQRSARALGLSDSLRINPLGEAVRRTAERAGEANARIRLTITAGDAAALAAAPGVRASAIEPTILIVAQPAPEYPDSLFERGVMVSVSRARISPHDPTAGHKTLNYWWRLRELQAAGAAGAAEALLFDTANRLASGMVSNALLVKGGSVLTPPARDDETAAPLDAAPPPAPADAPTSPVLPGITRAFALDAADELGLETSIQPITIDDVLNADELMLTNSGWGILPVASVEASGVGSGAPGPVARWLRAKWLSAQREQADSGRS